MILFDTDIYTLYRQGNEQIIRRMEASRDEGVFITVITEIEVLRGRHASVLTAENGDRLHRAIVNLASAKTDIASRPIVNVDSASAAEFDRLRENKKLKKIGRADLLIACIALANNATLITRNLRHFNQVPGLKVENWAD